jgi:hypothetical protein
MERTEKKFVPEGRNISRNKFSFARRETQTLAKTLIILEKRFNKELNNIILPCGEKLKLASSISRYEKMRLMMQTKGFSEHITLTNSEYAARMINAYQLRVKNN